MYNSISYSAHTDNVMVVKQYCLIMKTESKVTEKQEAISKAEERGKPLLILSRKTFLYPPGNREECFVHLKVR